MSRAYKIFSVVIVLSSIFSTASLAGQFKITWIEDRDTIIVEGCDIEVKVRLIGIDAVDHPRLPYAIEARNHLAKMVWKKIVEIEGYGLGSSNHVLGVIHLNGKNINLEMVRAGLAVAYRGRLPKGFDITPYLEAERDAREARRGIWSPEV
jgi:micrococcal nuclease